MSTTFPMPGMQVRFAGETNVGMKRSHNEDSIYLPDTERLLVVADGMGGHASGDVASATAVETIAEFFKATEEEPDITWPFMIDANGRADENRLVTSIKLANLKIFEAASKNAKLKGMGTTVVACFITDEAVLLAHVGDSRIYRVRQHKIKQVTEDHSLLNDYIKMKRLDPEDAGSFPQKNVIVRALGMKENVGVDIQRHEPQIGDLYLLCSDGLNDMVSDPDILRCVLSEPDLDKCCDRLVKLANANGGQDNITVGLARLEPQS